MRSKFPRQITPKSFGTFRRWRSGSLLIVRAERRSETPGAGLATPVMETQTSTGWQRAFTGILARRSGKPDDLEGSLSFSRELIERWDSTEWPSSEHRPRGPPQTFVFKA